MTFGLTTDTFYFPLKGISHHKDTKIPRPQNRATSFSKMDYTGAILEWRHFSPLLQKWLFHNRATHGDLHSTTPDFPVRPQLCSLVHHRARSEESHSITRKFPTRRSRAISLPVDDKVLNHIVLRFQSLSSTAIWDVISKWDRKRPLS